MVQRTSITLTWSPALTHDLDHIAFYELSVDGARRLLATPGNSCAVLLNNITLTAGGQSWQVRAVNGKGVRGGWSLSIHLTDEL